LILEGAYGPRLEGILYFKIGCSHVDSLTRGEYNLVWIFFTSQSRLIIIPKIMLNLEIVCDTLNRIFGVVEVIVFPAYITWQIIRTISLFEKLAKYAKLYWT
jgi:hypothetical protein